MLPKFSASCRRVRPDAAVRRKLRPMPSGGRTIVQPPPRTHSGHSDDWQPGPNFRETLTRAHYNGYNPTVKR